MKILVTTDLSSNSKAGIRFAVSLANSHKASLVFFHSFFLRKPASSSEAAYQASVAEEKEKLLNSLKSFVESVYSSMQIFPGKIIYVVEKGIIHESGIMKTARKQKADYICMSTRGGGRFRKIFGSTAGNLIRQSLIPVIAVPNNYKAKSLNSILYASDFLNYKKELTKVISFAEPLKASIEVLHFSTLSKPVTNKELISAGMKRKYKYEINFNLKKTNLSLSHKESLKKAIAVSRPALLVMFTAQRKTFFQKLFLSSNTESVAFEVKVPMLVFNKTEK